LLCGHFTIAAGYGKIVIAAGCYARGEAAAAEMAAGLPPKAKPAGMPGKINALRSFYHITTIFGIPILKIKKEEP
jgi:hypothetical protein